MLLNALRMHSHFTTFEPPNSGKFPRSIYDSIIAETQRMLTSMALMAHTTQTLDANLPSTEQYEDPENKNKWISRLASIALQSTAFRSQNTTSLLCHLSASIMNAQPLPPFYPRDRHSRWHVSFSKLTTSCWIFAMLRIPLFWHSCHWRS